MSACRDALWSLWVALSSPRLHSVPAPSQKRTLYSMLKSTTIRLSPVSDSLLDQRNMDKISPCNLAVLELLHRLVPF